MNLSQAIFEARVGLNSLAGEVPPEAWARIKAISNDLHAAQVRTQVLERNLETLAEGDQRVLEGFYTPDTLPPGALAVPREVHDARA